MNLTAVNYAPGGNTTEDFDSSVTEPKPKAQSYRVDFKGLSIFDMSLLTLNICTNFYIFLIICIKRKYRKRTNFLIANLALASMVYNAVIVVRYVEAHFQPAMSYYHMGLCGFFAVMHRFPMPVMSMTTMAISLERSHSAFSTAPLHSIPSRTWTALKVVTIWSISILITLPTALINVVDANATVNSYRKCNRVVLYAHWFHLSYVALYVVIVFVIPTGVLLAELLRMRAKLKFLTWRQEKSTCRTDERLRLVRNACIFTALFIIFWVPIGLHLILYDMPNEILSEKWKSENLVSFRGLQCIANYYILAIPLLLFMMSDGLRESLCPCLSSNRLQPTDALSPVSIFHSWKRYYHDRCCFCCFPVCRSTNGTSDAELSTL